MDRVYRLEFYFLLFLVGSSLVSIFLIKGCRGLRDVRLEMPAYVRRGNDVRLRCQYDMEGDALYAVKWYKGQQEFYRFVPKEVPPEKVFPLPGLTVHVQNSNDHDVVLLRVSLELTGTFRCVVSAESPFQTLSAAAGLVVLVIGDDRPFLQLDRAQYHPGDSVKAQCRSPPSIPPANVTWYLDNKELSPGFGGKTEETHRGTGVTLQTEGHGLMMWTESVITFDLPVALAPVQIKCRARVFQAYDQNSSTFPLVPVARTLSGPDTLLRSIGSSSLILSSWSSSWRRWLLPFIPIMLN